MRVTPQLDILDTVYISNVDGGQNIPAVTFNGSDFVVAFVDTRYDKGIVASRVSSQGMVMDTGYTIDDGNNNPDIASAGGRSLVVWSKEYSGVWARFVDSLAMPLDSAFCVAPILASSTAPKICCGNGIFLAVWADFNTGGGSLDIFSQAISGTGQLVGDRAVIARNDETQKNPVADFDGGNFIVAWQEGFSRIVGRFVGMDGKPAGETFFISDTSAPNERQNPAIAAGVSGYLTVWAEYHDGFDIYGSVDDLINIEEDGIAPLRSDRAATVLLSAHELKRLRPFSIRDVCGRTIMPEQAVRGVYFVTAEDGSVYKAVLIR